MSKKRFPNMHRLKRKVGAESVVEGILMLESGASKKEVAGFWGVSAAYVSNFLKEIGPPVTVYRIPADLLGLEDAGFTDDLGAIASHRHGHNAQTFRDAYSVDLLPASDVIEHLKSADQVTYDSLVLNTAARALRYAGALEHSKFEG